MEKYPDLFVTLKCFYANTTSILNVKALVVPFNDILSI